MIYFSQQTFSTKCRTSCRAKFDDPLPHPLQYWIKQVKTSKYKRSWVMHVWLWDQLCNFLYRITFVLQRKLGTRNRKLGEQWCFYRQGFTGHTAKGKHAQMREHTSWRFFIMMLNSNIDVWPILYTSAVRSQAANITVHTEWAWHVPSCQECEECGHTCMSTHKSIPAIATLTLQLSVWYSWVLQILYK